jgi:hypothetical protein
LHWIRAIGMRKLPKHTVKYVRANEKILLLLLLLLPCIETYVYPLSSKNYMSSCAAMDGVASTHHSMQASHCSPHYEHTAVAACSNTLVAQQQLYYTAVAGEAVLHCCRPAL